MSYYDNSQWPAAGQSGWDHQTPPARSGASSAIPREEPAAFTHQIEEVDRAIDNLVKSGKMFGGPGRHGRSGAGAGNRPPSVGEFGEGRGAHQQSNLQNFYASQRHQTSRGSNEAEQVMQAKRRMAAQRERELRNYHQEQQYNRTVLAELSSYGNKPDRTLSPSGMSEDDRRELIARQREALYREGAASYVDETGTPRSGPPAPPNGPASMRGQSPLTYEYGRTPPIHPDAGSQPPVEGAQGSQSAGPNQRSRANSNASPQSNNAGNKGVFEGTSRTSNSSPGGSPSNVKPQGGNAVAPIGTRPSGTVPGASNQAAQNPALNKRSTTPLPSPLSQGYSAPGSGDNNTPTSTGAPSNPTSAAGEGPVGLSGWGGRPGVWGNKSGLGVQASVWG